MNPRNFTTEIVRELEAEIERAQTERDELNDRANDPSLDRETALRLRFEASIAFGRISGLRTAIRVAQMEAMYAA